MIYLVLSDKPTKGNNILSATTLKDFEIYLQRMNPFDEEQIGELYIIQLTVTCSEFILLKNQFHRLNIQTQCIFSNCRETIISAKSMRFYSIFNSEINKIINSIKKREIEGNNKTHLGMVRSGDILSSNGNLIIIGDVNPGGFISAKNNIYVWGKLSGIAFAGNNGNNSCSISSLYLNPLQLRINKTIAIGPKEKPISYYPEVASIEKDKIVIKPFIINK
tara:strand:+ start:745 stop:1404 length:660 start_codon:yes stop_codon:yes gene_type:complete